MKRKMVWAIQQAVVYDKTKPASNLGNFHYEYLVVDKFVKRADRAPGTECVRLAQYR